MCPNSCRRNENTTRTRHIAKSPAHLPVSPRWYSRHVMMVLLRYRMRNAIESITMETKMSLSSSLLNLFFPYPGLTWIS